MHCTTNSDIVASYLNVFTMRMKFGRFVELHMELLKLKCRMSNNDFSLILSQYFVCKSIVNFQFNLFSDFVKMCLFQLVAG